MPMAAEKITKALKKALFRLEAMQEEQELSILDREMIGKLLLEAYEDLWTYDIEEDEHPGKNDHFEFEVEEENENRTVKAPQVSSGSEALPDPEKQPTAKEKEIVEEKEMEPERSGPSESISKSTEENVPEELKEIFSVKQSQELSERLSQLPIDDIWTAMGLNERIFTQNELFGGDHELFKQTVQKINQMNSFAEAKSYLIENIAQNQNWASEDRVKIAKNFVKLIHRRF